MKYFMYFLVAIPWAIALIVTFLLAIACVSEECYVVGFDLMIFSMGYSEHVEFDDISRNLWVNARREVSQMAKIFVDSMSIKPLPKDKGGEI